MGFAEMVNCPVLLVGDIDRGGVFAQLVGTLALISESERRRTKGFVINCFRGDLSLLEPGLDWLTERTGKPVAGVLPYLHGLVLDAEDSVGTSSEHDEGALKVVVPVLPRISNHNDFDPLRLHPGVELIFVGPDQTPPPADVIILPGSKHTRSDLDWLRANGWLKVLERHLRYGGHVFGICGGFQMLGRTVNDPDGLEGTPGVTAGLGWLDIDTRMVAGKQLTRVAGTLQTTPEQSPATVSGYEIHNGVTTGPGLEHPLVQLPDKVDGAISADGRVMGTYLHGVFDDPAACSRLLAHWGLTDTGQAVDYAAHREQQLDRLADAVEDCLDTGWLKQLLGV